MHLLSVSRQSSSSLDRMTEGQSRSVQQTHVHTHAPPEMGLHEELINMLCTCTTVQMSVCQVYWKSQLRRSVGEEGKVGTSWYRTRDYLCPIDRFQQPKPTNQVVTIQLELLKPRNRSYVSCPGLISTGANFPFLTYTSSES